MTAWYNPELDEIGLVERDSGYSWLMRRGGRLFMVHRPLQKRWTYVGEM